MSTFHPRVEWQNPAQPVIGPAFPAPAKIDTAVIHYTAMPNLADGDPGETQAQVAALLRATQNDYTKNRGYSIGYNDAVDGWGDVWELRGETIKAAATLNHNDHTYAILILVDGQDGMSPAQFEAVAQRIFALEQKVGKWLQIKGHRDFAATGCPGNGAYAQLTALRARVAQLRNPVKPEPPQPEVPEVKPPSEEDDMPKYLQLVATGKPEAIVAMDGAGVTFVPIPTADDAVSLGKALGAVYTKVSGAQYDEFHKASLARDLA